MKRFLAILLIFIASSVFGQDKVIDHLQDISVMVTADSGSGSGILVTRKVEDKDVTFVWTAAHVVQKLRIGENQFTDAKVIRQYRFNGSVLGELQLDAKIIHYSADEDLALLQIQKSNSFVDSATFYLDERVPAIGTDVYHVGSFHGKIGYNSFSTGVVSQHSRNLGLDQTTAIIYPGSSGGGLFLKEDGRCIGLAVRTFGPGFSLYVPSRNMQKWAKRSKVEWALDTSVPMPTAEELAKLPVEDASASALNWNRDINKPCPANVEYPFLLIWKSAVSPDATDKPRSLLDILHK